MTINYQTRLTELVNNVKENSLDIAMITTPANVFYYTGFNSDPHERFMALVVDILNDQTILFAPALDKEIAQENSFIKDIVPISDEEDPYAKLQEKLGGNIVRFGLEMKQVSMFQHQCLASIFPNAQYEDIQPFVNNQRLKKSRSELAYTKKAITIIEKVMTEGIKKVTTGMSELEFAAELEYLMKQFGAEGPSFSTIVLSGEKTALPHGTPGNRAFQKGDFLLIDMGVRITEGYCSDITRTFIIGDASERQKEIYEIVRQSALAGIQAVKADVPLKTFDIAARNVIKENGYGKYFNNRVGHGLGIEVHEEPSIHENNEQIAENGLFFTIEPGIYIPNYGGVRIEDNVYINEQGKGEVLTGFQRDLQIL
ncbi:Xaa-Pro peptidase family protein [Lentibacillus sp. N15]|uniref:M24 family metallopeptidase n=1 Tax=Lentibacillus songyuanensis TaxID=3136161 RepID=UPI0031BB0719